MNTSETQKSLESPGALDRPIRVFSYDHPECLEGEIYLGNFSTEEARNIGWRTKSAGCWSYCADGKPYPYQKESGILPYFCDVAELKVAGIEVPERHV